MCFHIIFCSYYLWAIFVKCRPLQYDKGCGGNLRYFDCTCFTLYFKRLTSKDDILSYKPSRHAQLQPNSPNKVSADRHGTWASIHWAVRRLAVKTRSREIGCCNDHIALKFDRLLGSSAAEVSVKLQSDWERLNPNLAASGLCEILR